MILRCPNCKRLMWSICLTSYPAKYECGCNNCGFALRYWMRKDSHLNITQEEVNEFYELQKELEE